jgi:hypothetical protein
MTVSEARWLKELEAENARLKKLLAESMLENEITREALRKKVVTAPARRELVRQMVSEGLSERRALTAAHMSASALRYATAGPQRGAARAHSCAGVPAQALRRGDDPSEAAAGRAAGELQARGTAVSGIETAGAGSSTRRCLSPSGSR